MDFDQEDKHLFILCNLCVLNGKIRNSNEQIQNDLDSRLRGNDPDTSGLSPKPNGTQHGPDGAGLSIHPTME
jgi:hypothetical protein